MPTKTRKDYIALSETALRQVSQCFREFDVEEHDAEKAIATMLVFNQQAETYAKLAALTPEPSDTQPDDALPLLIAIASDYEAYMTCDGSPDTHNRLIRDLEQAHTFVNSKKETANG